MQTEVKVISVNISESKGTRKTPATFVDLKPNHGIIGDAHAGPGKRQVSLLAIESFQENESLKLNPGAYAENITTQGLTLHALPIGTRLKIGNVLTEVSQIGKECHAGCEIQKQTGKCVMPTEGIFVQILSNGTIHPGDTIEVLS